MNRPKPKPIEHTREDLVREGFAWIETRKCKRCGHFIEVWRTPSPGARVALEIRPDVEWKLLPHVNYCTGEKKTPKSEQTELFA